MSDPSSRPPRLDLMFLYQGQPHIVERIAPNEFYLTCPKCGRRQEIALHPTEGHAIWKNVRDQLCVEPSVVCGNNCGWHVVITNGEAKDA